MKQHRINLNQTAAEAAAAIKLAEASGDAQTIKAAVISHAYVAEREAIANVAKAREYYQRWNAAAEAACKNGDQDLAGGGDCWAVIKAEGAEAALYEAEKERRQAGEHKAAIMSHYQSIR